MLLAKKVGFVLRNIFLSHSLCLGVEGGIRLTTVCELNYNKNF
jgi:hypothetical protein